MSERRVAFEKWEGLGNDFVIVEDDPDTWSDARVAAVCDRHFGVGADGVLFVSADPPCMVVRNADGSRPEMCGNGIRCVAGYLAKGRHGSMVIQSDAGPKTCEVTGEDGRVEVSVGMGDVATVGELVVTHDGRTTRFSCVDIGNPHAITFEPFGQGEIDTVGPTVATLPSGGTNVEFCRFVWDGADAPRVDVTVWERGVGRTLACGTGACAVAHAAIETGHFKEGEPLRVRLPGGDLFITIAGRAVTMRGPARRVFRGELGAA
ncbi:MAG: diaminopimelate epimerase [Polyangiaceae bacterium]